MADEMTETKERIFDTFIDMISVSGYENVSMREIAKNVGINSASIYHHYKSKDKILEHIYEYFDEHYYMNRPSVEEVERIVETGDAAQIIGALHRSFETDDYKVYVRMIKINRIIYMRLFQDMAATAMFARHNDQETDYVVEILQHGIDIGRIDPDFDTRTYAIMLIGVMVSMAMNAYSDPNYGVGEVDIRGSILAVHAKLLSSVLHDPKE